MYMAHMHIQLQIGVGVIHYIYLKRYVYLTKQCISIALNFQGFLIFSSIQAVGRKYMCCVKTNKWYIKKIKLLVKALECTCAAYLGQVAK